MKASRFFKGALTALTAAALLGLTGCEPETIEVEKEVTVEVEKEVPVEVEKIVEVEKTIFGTWNDGYSDTVIAANKITSSYGTHENTTVMLRKLSETSGYIYFQLKNDVEGYGPAPDYAPYTVEGSSGKWSAIYYTELSSKSVKMCDAYSYTSPYDFPATIEECIQNYTIENGNGYFGYTPVFTRKN